MDLDKEIKSSFSFLNKRYGFEDPIFENWKNEEFCYYWKKENIKFYMYSSWVTFSNRNFDLPIFIFEIPNRRKPAFSRTESVSLDKILENEYGIPSVDIERYDRIRKIRSCKKRVRRKRNELLDKLFLKRLNQVSNHLERNYYEIINLLKE